WICEIALLSPFCLCVERPQVPEIDYDNGQDRSQLDHYLKHIHEIRVRLQRKDLIDQYHVAGAADWKPFGDSLYDTKQNNLQPFNKFHLLYLSYSLFLF